MRSTSVNNCESSSMKVHPADVYSRSVCPYNNGLIFAQLPFSFKEGEIENVKLTRGKAV